MHYVALRKESVDRNVNLRVVDGSKSSSLSARRAWIEMDGVVSGSADYVSLSARRAWIEIFYYADKDCDWVSLSARRAWIEIT